MRANNIVFFASREAAIELCERGGMTEIERFFVVEAIGRPGRFVIEVRDPDAGALLGHL